MAAHSRAGRPFKPRTTNGTTDDGKSAAGVVVPDEDSVPIFVQVQPLPGRHPDFRKPFDPTPCPRAGCSYVAGTRDRLTRHELAVHQGVRAFACTWTGCQYRGSQAAGLKHHYRTTHLKEKWLQCHVCPQKFSHKTNLRCHMQSHAKEGHNMDSCSHCLKHLAWTPGRGKRAKQPDAPSSLLIHWKKRILTPGHTVTTTASPSVPCHRPAITATASSAASQSRRPAQSVGQSMRCLFSRPSDQTWDELMADMVANASDSNPSTSSPTASPQPQPVDSLMQDSRSSVSTNNNNNDGIRQDSDSRFRRRSRVRLVQCRKLGCTFITSDSSELDRHVAGHTDPSSSSSGGKNKSAQKEKSSPREADPGLQQESPTARSVKEEEVDVTTRGSGGEDEDTGIGASVEDEEFSSCSEVEEEPDDDGQDSGLVDMGAEDEDEEWAEDEDEVAGEIADSMFLSGLLSSSQPDPQSAS